MPGDRLSDDLASLRIDRDAPRPRRTLPLLIAAAAIGIGLAGALLVTRPSVKARLVKPEVETTEVALISPAQATVRFTSTGYVVPQVVSRVGAKAPGRIARVAVKEGDSVRAGEILAVLEDADLRSAIATANARVLAAQARAQSARANLLEVEQRVARTEPLVARQVAPRAELEDLQARRLALVESVRAAEADVRAAASELETLRTSLGNMTIVSPIDGTVVSKPAEAGELVGPQVGSVAEIADFGSLVVETDVPEARLNLAQAGGPCEIVLDAYPAERHRGRVQSIGKRVNRAKGTVTVKVAFVDAIERALPDMSARVGFLSAELSPDALKEPPRLVVPAAALAERDGRKLIFVLEDGKARATAVRLGSAVGPAFELLDGPPPGTRLVAHPPAWLADGQRVKERGD